MSSDVDLARRAHRRRQMIVYGGAGSGVIGILVTVYFVFFAVAVYRTVGEALTKIRRDHPTALLNQDPGSGYVTALSNLESSTKQGERLEGSAAASYAVKFIEQPEVAAALGVPREADLRVVGDPIPDPQLEDYEIVRIQQYVDDVRLFGADIAVSMRSGPSAAINTIATRPATVPQMDTKASIDQPAARATALRHYASLAEDPARRLPRDVQVDEAELVIFDPNRFVIEGTAALAWRFQLEHLHVFVDAKDGRVILSYDDRPTVLNRLTHDCRQTLDCQLVLDEKGPVRSLPPVGAEAKRAHEAFAAAHAYFKNTFQRDGYDDTAGSGGKANTESFVQVRDFNNAQWVRRRKRFDFGMGWTTLDIAAHEYTHALTSAGPALTYLGQSGAVDEFFADFFGAMVERSITGVMDWRIGEGLPGRSAARPLRSMANPNNGGFNRDTKYHEITNAGQPDNFDHVVKPAHTICSSVGGDQGCVHFNSGVLSKAIYLTLVGERLNGTKVTPVSQAKVEQIMFRTLTGGGMSTSPNLLDAANGAVRACRQLIGTQGIQESDCTALRNAFVEVKFPVAP